MLFSALNKVFRKATYLALAALVALLMLALSTWLPNLGLIWQITSSPMVVFSEKVIFLANLMTSIGTNFTALSASYTVAIAVLLGINTAMVVYYMRQKKSAPIRSGVTGSLAGFVSGVFGVGCAACGTLVLGPLLALIGAGGLIYVLPLNGGEFGLLSVGILGTSIIFTAKKINNLQVCNINNNLN